MFPLTRTLSLAAAAALVVLTAFSIPALAGEAAVGSRATSFHGSDNGNCALLKRAISRRACQARLQRELHIDTAENK
jgi:hypothetical protein